LIADFGSSRQDPEIPHRRMSQVRYLIDENLPLSLVAALRRAEPGIDVWRLGQTNMPAFGCDDRTLLAFCEQSQRLLVSLDRASMPKSFR
jgi:Domain of unknown function (DUF5615)